MAHRTKFFNANTARGLILSMLVLLPLSASLAQKAVPELWGTRVHDDAHVLRQETIDALENNLKAFEDSTSNQIAILLISSLDGDVLEEYSIRVVEKWKLGSEKNDNGVLLLIVVDDRQLRIEVGQGLEGVLTDAISSQIIRNEITPKFKAGDYDAGVTDGVDAIVKAIGGEYTGGELTELDSGDRIFIGIFIFILLGVFTFTAISTSGCFGWGLYVFLLPFYIAFPWVVIGANAATALFLIYLVSVPILKIILNKNPKWNAKMSKWSTGSGSGRSWTSGGGGSSWSGGSSFSGGGGSFGGGGSSGRW